jgi:hypothetical protein
MPAWAEKKTSAQMERMYRPGPIRGSGQSKISTEVVRQDYLVATNVVCGTQRSDDWAVTFSDLADAVHQGQPKRRIGSARMLVLAQACCPLLGRPTPPTRRQRPHRMLAVPACHRT